jgi:hypothetical protein
MLSCASCHYSLIGERQKGHVHYRCHSKQCRGNTIREETIEMGTMQFFEQIHFNEEEKAYFRPRIVQLRETWTSKREEEMKSLNLRNDQIKDRLNRLTDAYIDQALDKTMFEERKKSLLLDQKTVEENLTNLNRDNSQQQDRLEIFLELAGNAWLSHQIALPEERREMVNISTSNRQIDGKKLYLKPSLAFQSIADRYQTESCCPKRDVPRTWDRILDTLAKLNAQGLVPDLSTIPGFQSKNTREKELVKE